MPLNTVDNDHQKQRILGFLKHHQIGVIATTKSGLQPEAAAVEYGETEDLELIIDTFVNSRKWGNIQKNPRVAFVVGWDQDITVQYEGRVTQLQGEELTKSKNTYFAKNPRAQKWEGREGVIYFKIVPTWIRYTDTNKNPWEIFELTF